MSDEKEKAEGIYPAMAKVMSQIGNIGKDNKNKAQGFSFRGIDDIYNHVHGLLAANDIFCLADTLSAEREVRQSKNGGCLYVTHLRIKFSFVHKDGSRVSTTLQGEGMDSADKGTNKATSVSHKYAFLTTFAIPTIEMAEPDRDSFDQTIMLIDEERVAGLKAAAEEVGANIGAMFEYLKGKEMIRKTVQSLSDLTTDEANTVSNAIQAKRKTA